MDYLDSKFFDSHIHINSNSLSFLFLKSHLKYSDWIFNNVSTTLEDFEKAIEQSNKYKNVFVTAGIHPLEIGDLDFETVIHKIDSEISVNSRIIAIGETGLDFFRVSKEECYLNQKKWFLKHLELSKKHNLPLVIHVRNAHIELLEILEENKDVFGVIHCFEGDLETANRYLNLNKRWMLSISPIVFREGCKCREIIKHIDLNRLLVETDAPYLCDSFEKIKEIVNFISLEKQISFEECKRVLWRNFCNVFNIKNIN